MTVTTGIATASLAWTGVETTFAPGFQAQNVGDVSVLYSSATVIGVLLVLGTHYALTLDAYGNVTVTPIALPPAPATLTFNRNSNALQEDSFADGQPWSAEVIGAALDLAALRDQEIRRDLNATASSPSALAAAAAAAIATAMAAWPATLPRVLPDIPGQWWIDDNGTGQGGGLALS